MQSVQNVADHLIFNHLKRSHITPLLMELHELPVAAHVQVTSADLQNTGWICSSYLNSLVRAPSSAAFLT